nr:protein spalten-like [Cherax quadricarinatus]
MVFLVLLLVAAVVGANPNGVDDKGELRESRRLGSKPLPGPANDGIPGLFYSNIDVVTSTTSDPSQSPDTTTTTTTSTTTTPTTTTTERSLYIFSSIFGSNDEAQPSARETGVEAPARPVPPPHSHPFKLRGFR